MYVETQGKNEPERRLSTDPTFITALDWQRVEGLLLTLWWLLGSVLGFAGSMLLAQGVAPSLGFTGDLPRGTVRAVRPPLYGAAALFFVLALFSVNSFVGRLGILRDIFDKGLQ